MRRRHVLQTAALALVAPRLAIAEGARVLNFVPYADVAVTDPIWSSTYATRTSALAVYDTLYGTDAGLVARPQMVAGHVVEDDGRRWTLTLRDGLRFHDGERVLARDCVASIRRWGRRDAFGQALLAVTEELATPDDRTIRFRLKQPFPMLPDALGRASSLVPVMVPERLAKVDAYTRMPETIGSGPVRYLESERVPGARVVYEKFAGYQPREDGEPSFTAGPRIAYLDRLVFNVMPDPAAAAAALQAGEVDWVEQPLMDLVPLLRRNRDIVVEVKDRTGYIGQFRFNTLHPPFDNVALRRVLLAAIDQQDCMTAVVGGERANMGTHVGAYTPGSPFASEAGMARPKPDLARLKQAVLDAGYKGQRVVMLAAAEVPRITAVCEVTREVLARLGFNVDYVSTDWGTLNARVVSREPVERGGWSCYCTYVGGLDMMSPATHGMLRGGGVAGGSPGWLTSPRLEALRAAFFAAPDAAAQKAVAEQLQLQLWQDVPYVPLGQFIQPVAYRRSLTGMLDGAPVFTNLRKG
ncbi:ABC transporter substrate-binding protein [Siccirubricoccus sp. KC 17139]|uniref:ABC transporter substrate-binding protein n=1 Tax=Siccirubricoccus soli TaxID=2899147 RepID=A0ABT1DBL2_9PROT|nr:ABC transporter substrate-binding protein [Siccirubricoccus soli]MCO6419330.1 ABC transporter substrate-binding protein [Siccirubricoccus soli]MCP2685465.1 ABC transporter substrate-binding protein [Siccirubricoccus soli]